MEIVKNLIRNKLYRLYRNKDIEGLISALNNKNLVEMRRVAAYFLGELKYKPGIAPLIDALKDSDEEVRWKAASSLGKIGDSRAVKPLIEALNDHFSSVRNSAVESLGKLGWQPGKDSDGAIYWIAKHNFSECEKIGEPAVEKLIDTLEVESEIFRSSIAGTLGKIGDTRAVEPLIRILDNERDRRFITRTHRTAAWALGEIGDSRAVETLIYIIENDEEYDRETKWEAILALGKIRDIRVLEPLIVVLEANDNIYQDRWRAAFALGMIGSNRAVKPLTDALADENDYVRKTAADALEKIEPANTGE
jgi:HEAT repeat protein